MDKLKKTLDKEACAGIEKSSLNFKKDFMGLWHNFLSSSCYAVF